MGILLYPRVLLQRHAPWVIVAVILLGGCAVKLAPDFDRTIVDGLTQANENAMTLFASVSSGASSASFTQRQANYDALIGKLDALRIQANARPTPRPLFLQTIGLGPSINSNPKNIEVLKSPTSAVLATMIGTMTTMRDTDRQFGLTGKLAVGFKREFETSMDQALVYEKALER